MLVFIELYALSTRPFNELQAETANITARACRNFLRHALETIEHIVVHEVPVCTIGHLFPFLFSAKTIRYLPLKIYPRIFQVVPLTHLFEHLFGEPVFVRRKKRVRFCHSVHEREMKSVAERECGVIYLRPTYHEHFLRVERFPLFYRFFDRMRNDNAVVTP